MFKVRQIAVVLAVSLSMITGCSTSGGSSSTSTEATPTPIPAPVVVEKPTYTVKRGEVIDSLSFTGRVSPVIEEALYFRTSGYVKRVYVERNEMVEEGAVLAELENDDLLKELAQSQIELETAQLTLTEAEADQQFTVDEASISLGIMNLQLQKLQNSLQSADIAVQQAKGALDKALAGVDPVDLQIAQNELDQANNSLWAAQIRRDAECGGGKGADCDAAEAGVLSAEASVNTKQLQFQELQAGPDDLDLLDLQANYANAVASRDALALDIQIQEQNIKLKEMEVSKLSAEVDPQLTKSVDRAQLAVERLQAQVDDTQIVSPIAGKVTSVSAYEGRTADAYTQVFVVADESDLEITAEPLSSQLQELAEGMDATLVLSAYPGKELTAQIIQLPYPYGGGGGESLEDADKMTHLSFDSGDLALEAGDVVKVNVVIERKEDALWLPPAAIRTFSGRTFVVVQDGDAQRRVDVVIGIEGSERVEIEDGLEEGQIVVGQ